MRQPPRMPTWRPPRPSMPLTKRQMEILYQIGLGKSQKEIAAHFRIARGTVEFHRQNIKDKLQLKTTPQLIRYAVLLECQTLEARK
jgi:DNA-binding CsgD family transcriptional regulator